MKAYGYSIACKVHTKKTPQSEIRTGDEWRESLMGPLLGSPSSVAEAKKIFARESDVGVLAPKDSLVDLRIPHVHLRHTYWLDRLLYQIGRSDLVGKYSWEFAAGSMYWFRLDALTGIEDWFLKDDGFEPELGQLDGTLHHAFERLVVLYAQGRGYKTKEVSFETQAAKAKAEAQPKEKPPVEGVSAVMDELSRVCLGIDREATRIDSDAADAVGEKERDLANETWVLGQLQRSWSWK